MASSYAGIQSAAMVLANIVRDIILPPDKWNTLARYRNMIEDDSVCKSIRILSNENPDGNIIDATGYLESMQL